MPRPLMATDQILSVLEETPVRLGALTSGLPEAVLHAAPAPGEWSVVEIVAHLRSCADMWGGAIRSMVETTHPTIRAVNPTTWIERTDYRQLELAPSLSAFTTQRSELLAVLGPLPARGWARKATVLGAGKPLELTVHSYAARLARHERTHWRQVAKTVGMVMPG